ncbi:VIT domain-containing protein [Actinospica sp.]|uniref:VIT domain-containing protein n=1 Tax=Actinospica sp. TaxID=1872142 RepID=UPI002C113B8A|nr:VIT domain-containing protein [Actinospica sp.]HWG26194.1 VIT domain-containing protein [Actinospica sp.]
MGMITRIDPLPETREAADSVPEESAGLGALRTERGNLPLHRLDVRADITGLSSAIRLTQGFRNTFDGPLEATYIFPLPDRAAVTALSMTVAGRVVRADLKERGAARQAYDTAIAAGQRASIAEEERPDVFTLRVGNILPGEEAVVQLTLAGPLPLVDGQAEFRFPLVVAPRYIPGTPLPGPSAGSGWAADTDAVPDASRITPPTLLPGFPNPVDLSIEARIDPAGLELAGVASSLHAVTEGDDGVLRILPGERLNRDFILRLDYTGAADSLVLVPDPDAEDAEAPAAEGTYQLVVMPPEPGEAARARPKELILLLDRSGSMDGWKMVAARRAAARIIDTLTDADRFSVLLFDHSVERPPALPAGLVRASDRNRFRAIEHLAKAEARGGTELLAPLRAAAAELASAAAVATAEPGDGASPRDRVLVLVTDGQVGNEDHILAQITGELSGVRVHTVGIDRAVNAGFLGRLAAIGGGRCELVESEDRLDAAMDRIHRRIGSPTVTDLRIEDADGLTTVADSASPGRISALFPGVPLVRSGRYKGAGGGDNAGAVTISGLTVEGEPWSRTVHAVVAHDRPEIAAIWARARLRDLEDRYAVRGDADLEQEIVRTSLRHGVLCRFTAYVAIDSEVAATDGSAPHEVTQLVELPMDWMDQEAPRGRSPHVRRPHAGPAPAAPPAPEPGIGAAFSGTVGGASAPPPQSAPSVVRATYTSASAASAAPTSSMPKRASRMAAPAQDQLHVLDHASMVREQAATEARLLRDSAAEPAFRRRDLLDDLASRLDALLLHVRSTAGDSETVAALRALIAVLRDDQAPLDERWTRTLTLLDDLAGEPAAARRHFWKRG